MFDEGQHLRERILFLDDGVSDIRPVETGDEGFAVLEPQALDDVAARGRVGRGGERKTRYMGELLGQRAKLHIFGPEIVAPLRDAMRFVDGEQRERRLL